MDNIISNIIILLPYIFILIYIFIILIYICIILIYICIIFCIFIILICILKIEIYICIIFCIFKIGICIFKIEMYICIRMCIYKRLRSGGSMRLPILGMCIKNRDVYIRIGMCIWNRICILKIEIYIHLYFCWQQNIMCIRIFWWCCCFWGLKVLGRETCDPGSCAHRPAPGLVRKIQGRRGVAMALDLIGKWQQK